MQLILAHNHPNGLAFPSNADLNLTNTLNNILKGIRNQVVRPLNGTTMVFTHFRMLALD
jgi:DNA repair protein RadC